MISIFSPTEILTLQTASRKALALLRRRKIPALQGGETPNRKGTFSHGAAFFTRRGVRENESPESKPFAARQTMCATSQVDARMETQSSVRQAGTRPPC